MAVDVSGKSLVELLDMLEPAPAPDPIAMTPQTWGWAVLAVVLAAALTYCFYLARRHWSANAYRRSALAELERAGTNAARAAEILRRTALVAFPRATVASLHGQEWLNFLNQTYEKKEFKGASGEVLLAAPYQETVQNTDVPDLVRSWIKLHKRDQGA
ncbi:MULTISPECIES: DUF4381 domain-containing protein [unclassified Ruegeria]|uniref:DUF4381 domain-containing protein n=1 Tax=unclassified Ruegeria TaxID=2625375 RepID=UPI001488B302|nr:MULTISPECIES: DUF4381 domain-containing protein [unclassified Ruegeria]